MAATEAYDVLSDVHQKLRYDEWLEAEAKHAAAKAQQSVSGPPQPAAPKPSARPGWNQPPSETTPIAVDVQRVSSLFARGRHAEAENLARQVLLAAPRNPVCCAVLGDIARLRGDVNEAARMYAYAAQFEPSNPVYQRRYEELLNSTRTVVDGRQRTRLENEDRQILAPMVGSGLVIGAAVFVALSPEKAIFGKLPFISSWTLGLPIVLFLAGIGVGATLAMGNLLDRFSALTTTATGRAGPTVALGLVAIANFWVAVLLYLLLGGFQRAFNFSTTRTVLGTAIATVVIAFGAGLGSAISPGQVLLWGGNLVYIGSLVGWLVADAFRQ